GPANKTRQQSEKSRGFVSARSKREIEPALDGGTPFLSTALAARVANSGATPLQRGDLSPHPGRRRRRDWWVGESPLSPWLRILQNSRFGPGRRPARGRRDDERLAASVDARSGRTGRWSRSLLGSPNGRLARRHSFVGSGGGRERAAAVPHRAD